ncbi:MAG: hypothetical protein ACI915_000373 [Gammaproteobacteria bacterium]|jgi:hypothetical protein
MRSLAKRKANGWMWGTDDLRSGSLSLHRREVEIRLINRLINFRVGHERDAGSPNNGVKRLNKMLLPHHEA